MKQKREWEAREQERAEYDYEQYLERRRITWFSQVWKDKTP
jgi:hypothetical protein